MSTSETTHPQEGLRRVPSVLFPKPIPIIGCTGEYASGKSLFLLTISPKETRVYDMEKSCESYISLGFDRIDVPAELCRRYPAGYKPQQTFEWWRDDVRRIKPGQFRVIAVDPASEIESGLVEWVRNNPGYFGHTAAQYTRMSGLMWGDVKELWKSLLADLASRCETFGFTVHMGDVWSGDKPMPGKRKPKGKSTLMELASLYLQMERKPDAKGNVPAKPAAVVLKSRLAHTPLGADGELLIIPALPPRLPVATPNAIREYLLHPPDYAHLKPDELAPEQTMSEDDRATMRLATAEAERETEHLRLEKLQRQQEAEQRAANRQQTTKPPSPPPQIEPTGNGAAASNSRGERPTGPALAESTSAAAAPIDSQVPAPRRQTASFSAHAVTEEQLQTLGELRKLLFSATMADATDEAKKETWMKILAKRRVNTARALTQEQAVELISKLRTQLDIQAMQDGMDNSQEGDQADDAKSGG